MMRARGVCREKNILHILLFDGGRKGVNENNVLHRHGKSVTSFISRSSLPMREI